MPNLSWLPKNSDWKTLLADMPRKEAPWEALVGLANYSIDFVQTGQLDRRVSSAAGEPPVLRVAVLASSTVDQLLPGLRVAALRRGYRLETYLPDYGQYRQAVLQPSGLHAFAPDVVLFALDAHAVVGTQFLTDPADAEALIEKRVSDIVTLWRAVKSSFHCQIIQQTLLPVFTPLLGSAEHRVIGSPASMVAEINRRLRSEAGREGVDILALDGRVQQDGISEWFSAALWHRAKQEITPAASPFYGEMVMRTIDAQRGRSSKCLVLDLDNTLWGGVIGDDGLENISLGQGSAEGEAFVAFQTWVKALSQRGIILAVCSKNDEANAMEPFEKHPDMVLRRNDIASFVANWDDKASNIRRIAENLNIGIDSLVFVDDNPFERNIVRRELPAVKVPELPDDPSLWANCLADAGYFEALDVTSEDLARGQLYQASRKLREGVVPATDLVAYLKELDMRLVWGHFAPVAMKRITQLINKTNQFNLTTRRYTDAETAAMLEDPSVLGLYLRLVDRDADHGIIGVIIGRNGGNGDLDIEAWLMSCRVLGRGVERASLAVLAAESRKRGLRALVGHFLPSPKNKMVRDHYRDLGFEQIESQDDGATRWSFDLANEISPLETIRLEVA